MIRQLNSPGGGGGLGLNNPRAQQPPGAQQQQQPQQAQQQFYDDEPYQANASQFRFGAGKSVRANNFLGSGLGQRHLVFTPFK